MSSGPEGLARISVVRLGACRLRKGELDGTRGPPVLILAGGLQRRRELLRIWNLTGPMGPMRRKGAARVAE